MIRQIQIDGLRAVAILSVLLYHSGLSLFSGGFIGVDIFFVISGYLISNSLLNAPLNSYSNALIFIEGRIRRIVPALYVLLLITTISSYFLLIPSDLLKFSNSLLPSVSFTSNIYFWAARDGYFDLDSFLSPLIHTWSLGIEMQFYLAIFLIFLIAFRIRSNRILVISLLFFSSLALSIYYSNTKPGASFFLTPFRVWELLYGSILSLSFTGVCNPNKDKSNLLLKNIYSAAGLLGVLISLAIFNEKHGWPSYFALLPVISTGLILIFATPGTYTFRLLSPPLFVILGSMSYSIYLYHQPIFAFYKQYSLQAPNNYLLGACILVTLGIAYLSYRLIELPFKSKKFISINKIIIFTFVTGILLFLFQTLSNFTGGFKFRYSLPDTISQSLGRSQFNLNCYYQDVPINEPIKLCDLGSPSSNPSFMVIGDSHALSLYPAINQATISNRKSGIFASKLGCPPLLDISLLGDPSNQCRKFNELIFERSKSLRIKDIFLISKWNLYINGGYGALHLTPVIYGAKEASPKTPSPEEALKTALKDTIEKYQNAGMRVHLIKQIPQQITSPQRIYYKYYDDQDSSVLQAKILEFSVHSKKHQSLNKQFDNLINEIAIKIKNLDVISLDFIFCSPEICPIGSVDASYYFDDNHLSLNGALLTVPALKRILNSL